MKIEKIVKQNNGKYKIELDNKEKIITHADVILNNNILFKKELNNEILNTINKETSYYDIYNKILKYITIKRRSEKEVDEYLKKLNALEDDKIKIKKDLKQKNLINDKTFAQAFISDHMRLSNAGPYRIKNELLKHDIDQYLIEEELSKYSDKEIYDKLNNLILKKIKTLHNSKYVMTKKINEYFVNLGYSKDMINDILSKNVLDSKDAVIKDYKILFNKLSKKYNDQELEYEIKNRLYKKGYSSEEISKIKKD